MQTLTPFDAFEAIFDELWLALGPKERGDYTQRARVYHKHLRDIHAVSLRVGVERCIQAARIKALPAPGEVRARALEHAAELTRAVSHRAERDLEPVSATHCPCRCGGRRWYRVLRDPATKAVRHYPDDLAAQVAQAFGDLGRAPDFRRTADALAGEPMLRAHLACKRVPGSTVDAEPRSGYLGQHDDGCPVYDPDAPARQEVAA